MMSYISFLALISLANNVVVVGGNDLVQQRNGKEAMIPTIFPVSKLLQARQLPLRQTFTTKYPSWVNLTLLGIGQAFMRSNILGLIYAGGIGAGLDTNPDIKRTFVGIGNITNPNVAMRRSLSNLVYFKYWSIVDLVKDQDAFLETLNSIHSAHGKVAHKVSLKVSEYNKAIIPDPVQGTNPYNVNLKVWSAFERDLQNSKYRDYENKQSPLSIPCKLCHPMNQFTIAQSLWTFTHAVVVPENFLIHGATEEELMGYFHLWALIGHGLGLEDKYNICLQPNLETVKSYFVQFCRTYIIPPLFNLDYETKVGTEAIFKGLVNILTNLPVDSGVLIFRVCEDVLEIQCPEVKRLLNPESRFYNMVMGRLGHEVARLNLARSSLTFILNGLIQTSALHNFNFNTLIYHNFTNGLIELGERILKRQSNIEIDNDESNITYKY